MHVGQPCKVNPCSYEPVIKIMDHQKRICNFNIASSDDLQEWLLIQSNGAPYNLASDIQDNILTRKIFRLEIGKKRFRLFRMVLFFERTYQKLFIR